MARLGAQDKGLRQFPGHWGIAGGQEDSAQRGRPVGPVDWQSTDRLRKHEQHRSWSRQRCHLVCCARSCNTLEASRGWGTGWRRDDLRARAETQCHTSRRRGIRGRSLQIWGTWPLEGPQRRLIRRIYRQMPLRIMGSGRGSRYNGYLNRPRWHRAEVMWEMMIGVPAHQRLLHGNCTIGS